MKTRPDEYPKMYKLADQSSLNAQAQTIAQMRPGEFQHDGWPLDREKIEKMLKDGKLVEIDW